MGFLQFILELLFGKEPASFRSAHALDESVERLSAVVVRWPLQAIFRHALIGKVTKEKVVLGHQHPFFSNSFAPVFFGKFTVENGAAILEGCFTMHPFVKVFNAIWFGITLLMTVFCLFAAVTGIGTTNPTLQGRLLLLTPLGIFLTGLLFVWFFKRLGQRDITYISEQVQRVLNQ